MFHRRKLLAKSVCTSGDSLGGVLVYRREKVQNYKIHFTYVNLKRRRLQQDTIAWSRVRIKSIVEV